MADQAHIRNFSIIAHIDHGKSTLADRILELTHTVDPRAMRAQLLDSMDLERERGITIKAQAVRVFYTAQNGETYQLHLIDTPGHVDFTYEVSRSLAACEGALLVVDASQGVEAQTVANTYLAIDAGPRADPDHEQGRPAGRRARAGGGGDRRADRRGPRRGAPDLRQDRRGRQGAARADRPARPAAVTATRTRSPRALIFDSEYDQYRGVIAYIRVVDGTFHKGETIIGMQTGTQAEIDDIGFFTPAQLPAEQLGAGRGGLPDHRDQGRHAARRRRHADDQEPARRPRRCPGYRDVKPMVFCGLFPMNNDDYPELRDALEKLDAQRRGAVAGSRRPPTRSGSASAAASSACCTWTSCASASSASTTSS